MSAEMRDYTITVIEKLIEAGAGPLLDAAGGEELGRRRRVASDELLRFGSVGKAGGIAEEKIVGVGDESGNGSEYGKPADAGVKDSNGGTM